MNPTTLFEYGFRTDTGQKRKENQDHCNAFIPDSPELQKQKGFLFIVADGMGGHQGGKTASQMVTEITIEEYNKSNLNYPQKALKSGIKAANQRIFERGLREPKLRGMGSTCVALLLKDHIAFVAHVGDSRAYLISGNQIRQLTRDHSLTAEMVRQGMLSSKEAENHPEKNVLTRALGVQADVLVDIAPIEYQAGDIFLLCSDGLYNEIMNSKIAEIARQNSAQEACEKLVNLANEHGGRDNITIQVIKILQDIESTPTRFMTEKKEPVSSAPKENIADGDTLISEMKFNNQSSSSSASITIKKNNGNTNPGKEDLETLPEVESSFRPATRHHRKRSNRILITSLTIFTVVLLTLVIWLLNNRARKRSGAAQTSEITIQHDSTQSSLNNPRKAAQRFEVEQMLHQVDKLIISNKLDSAALEINHVRKFVENDTSTLILNSIANRYLRLGNALKKTGDTTQARAAFIEAQKLNPKSESAQKMLQGLEIN
ncbi:Stp1/IreP family PP2C-type Ser/Thr phosphatase [candidate division KSB1 bacterium]|nr:Stp1/IreP family PP2C-type Ser/Thr phosphatase [candidate division KSB1 bacterium]